MDAWTTLGLTPTADAKHIKKAYAVLLKQNKPDENPAGFAQLHSAYKQCLSYAKHAAEDSYHKEPSYHDEDSHGNEDNQTSNIIEANVDATATQQNSDYPQESEQLTIVKDEPQATETEAQTHLVLHSPLLADSYNTHVNNSEINSADPKNSTGETLTDANDNDNSDHIQNTNGNPEYVAPAMENSATISEPLAPNNNEATDDDETEKQRIAEAKHYLIHQTQAALEIMQIKDDIEAWFFIKNCDALYDLELKNGFNHYLFGQWVEFFDNNKITAHQRVNSLKFLNNYFDWIGQELDFEYDYEYAQIAAIFTALHSQPEQHIKWLVAKNHQGPIVHGNYYARLAATFLDWIMFGMIVASLSFIDFTVVAILIAITSHFFINAVLEASPLQGSLGKILFGLKVTNSKGRRINFFQSCWRQLLFLISTAGFKITLWINMFMSNGNLIHDQLSYTRVIKR